MEIIRIPHAAMLSRYSKVNPNSGSYTKPAQPAVVYGSLTFVRSKIVHHARLVLAHAVTVAVRYTAIRKQFADRDGDRNGPEMSVLDYPTVQIRILPLLATSFALHYTGLAMKAIYESARQDVERGDFGSLAHMHSMSSGLKSLCTTLTADGIETCRRALGGHGFGGGSGLIQINNDYLSKPTVEGDNWMITQQVAMYLIKKMDAAAKADDQMGADETDLRFREFLRKKHGKSKHDPEASSLKSDEAIAKAFELRATALVRWNFSSKVVSSAKTSRHMMLMSKEY